MEKMINMLHDGGYSCVIANGGIRTFSQRGVADLYGLLKNEPDFLEGAVIADKVVGKAAAALMVLGGIRKLHADVISLPALTLLRDAGVDVTYTEEVPVIWNRTKTDWCPLERLCYDENNAADMLPLIENFISKMRA